MIYPDTTPEKWAELYKIQPATISCVKCGLEQQVSIPFAEGDLRGFVAPEHSCGPQFRSFLCKSVDPKEVAAWREFYSIVSTALNER